MIRITDNIAVIENIGAANIFLLGSKKEYSLVDTGIFMKTKTLINELTINGYRLVNLDKIILTHCHCDHIGGVKELLDNSDAKVAAHKNDIPFILQERVIDGPYKGMMIEEQKVMKQLNCCVPRIDISLNDGDEIVDMEVILVPGHTPGSIALYSKSAKQMVFGDVIRENQRGELSIGKPEKFNCDTKQVYKDAEKLLSYDIRYGFLSHGKVYKDSEMELLHNLLKDA